MIPSSGAANGASGKESEQDRLLRGSHGEPRRLASVRFLAIVQTFRFAPQAAQAGAWSRTIWNAGCGGVGSSFGSAFMTRSGGRTTMTSVPSRTFDLRL